MSDIKASERRLTAALDRIDYLLETVSARQTVPARPAPDKITDDAEAQDLRGQLDAARAENLRLSEALAAALAAPGMAAGPSADDGGDCRPGSLSDQAARLSMANEELAAANRGLIDALAGEIDGVEAVAVALEAEIEALRAARSAEIAQISDIMVELQQMLAEPDGAARPDGDGAEAAALAAAGDASQADADSFGDAAGVPELTREPEPVFDAVYGEEQDRVFGEDDDDLDDAKRGGM